MVAEQRAGYDSAPASYWAVLVATSMTSLTLVYPLASLLPGGHFIQIPVFEDWLGTCIFFDVKPTSNAPWIDAVTDSTGDGVTTPLTAADTRVFFKRKAGKAKRFGFNLYYGWLRHEAADTTPRSGFLIEGLFSPPKSPISRRTVVFPAPLALRFMLETARRKFPALARQENNKAFLLTHLALHAMHLAQCLS